MKAFSYNNNVQEKIDREIVDRDTINVFTPVCPTSGTDWFGDAMGRTGLEMQWVSPQERRRGFIVDKPNCGRICELK